MNKFTKIAVGACLAVATLGIAAAPATADTAPTATSGNSTTATQGDRVTGIVGFWPYRNDTGAANFSTGRHPSPPTPNRVNDVLLTDSTAGITRAAWELPAVGTHGPINLAGTNDCISDIASPNPATGAMQWAACDGSAAQDFTVIKRSDGGYQIARADNLNRVFITGGGPYPNGVLVAMGASTGAWVITNYSSLTPVPGHTVVPVDITGPTDGSTVSTPTPKFEGTGDEGAEIIITDASGQELCRTTVVGGVWDCTSTVNLPDGPVDVTATQTATDGTVSTDTVSFIIPLPAPLIAPGIAALALGALGAGALIKRRKNKATV